jgi:hypothetical protein
MARNAALREELETGERVTNARKRVLQVQLEAADVAGHTRESEMDIGDELERQLQLRREAQQIADQAIREASRKSRRYRGGDARSHEDIAAEQRSAEDSTWSEPLYLVANPIDVELPVAGIPGLVLFTADPMLQLPTPPTDDSGRAIVGIQIGNPDDAIADQLLGTLASTNRIRAYVRWYTSDGELLLGPSEFFVHEPKGRGEPTMQVELRSRNDNDLSAHRNTFTLENTFYIRGYSR